MNKKSRGQRIAPATFFIKLCFLFAVAANGGLTTSVPKFEYCLSLRLGETTDVYYPRMRFELLLTSVLFVCTDDGSFGQYFPFQQAQQHVLG